MSSSESDGDSDWNRELLIAVSKKQGKGAAITEEDRCKQLQECLDRGADINSLDKKDNTALHMAVKKRYPKVVEFLLRNGARANVCNQQDHTAITLAEELNEEEIATILKGQCEQQSEQEFMSINHGEPSTSRKSPLKKRKPSTDYGYDKSSKKARSTFDDISYPERNSHGTVGTGSRGINSNEDRSSRSNEARTSRMPLSDRNEIYRLSPGLRDTLHGVVYQWKHLMLILYRAFKFRYAFRLATEMDVAEKWDDVVLKYENSKGDIIHRFVQLKHKQDGHKMVSANDLLDVKDGEFSMLKYFISWRKIKNNPDFVVSMSKKFILCTNIGLNVEELEHENIDVIKEEESDEFLKVTFRTKRPPLLYKLAAKPSKLYDTLKLASDVHRLAEDLAERVHRSKNLHLTNDIIKRYHLALAEKVIDTKGKKFFPDFINDTNLSTEAKNFREVFLVHVKKLIERDIPDEDIWDILKVNGGLKLSETFGSKFELVDKPQLTEVGQFSDKFVELVKNVSHDKVVKIDRRKFKAVADNIDKLAGHVLITRDEKIKFSSQFLNDNTTMAGNLKKFRTALKTQLESEFEKLGELAFEINNFKTCTEEELAQLTQLKQLTLSTKLPDDEIKDGEIRDFLNEFILAVNQPNEIELGEMIKHEIGADSQFNLLNANFIVDSFQSAILDWLKTSGKHNKFLANQDAKDFFLDIEIFLSTLIIVGWNSLYLAKLNKYDIKFERVFADLSDILGSTESTHKPILQFICAKPTSLSALRLYQTLEQTERYKKKDSFIFIYLDELMLPGIMDQVLLAFRSKHSHDLLIIDCKSISKNWDAQTSLNPLCDIMKKTPRKRMILIIQGDHNSPIQFEIGHQTFYEKDDDIGFNNLQKQSQQKLLKERVVKFQGQAEKTSFGRLLGIHDSNDIAAEVFRDLGRIIDPHALAQLIQGEEIEMGQEVEGLREIENYYIPRTIIQHVVIKEAVLLDPNIPDLFAISGIDRSTLVQSGSSFPRLDMDKYFILENGQATDHFRRICEQNSNFNVHWLQHESGRLLWRRSHGDITNLKVFEDVGGDYNCFDSFSEDDLVDCKGQNKIVILSDTAGMGKSTVLTSLARKIRHKHSDLLIIRIDLTKHTTVLAKEKEKPSFDPNNIDGAVDFLLDKLLNLDTDTKREVFKTIIKVRGEAALLFDGFDEISPDYGETITDLLQAFAALPIKKLMVTTRPHTREALKKKLKSFSYTLQPFSGADQVEFLIKFWKMRLNLNDHDKKIEDSLGKHADAVLKLLIKSINHQMAEFTGVPLQTRLVAEVFPYNEGKKLSHSDALEDNPESAMKAPELPETIDIIELYTRFIKKKYDISDTEKKLGNPTNLAERESTESANRGFSVDHQRLALYTLLDEAVIRKLSVTPSIEDTRDEEQRNIMKRLARIGIVTPNIDGRPHFIHRTFAEYFAAKFLFNTLNNNSHQQVQEFFLTQLFIEPEYETIRAFLNCLLLREHDTLEKPSWHFDLSENYNKTRRTVFHVAAKEGNVGIIRFVANRLSEAGKDKILHNIAEGYWPVESDTATGCDEHVKDDLSIIDRETSLVKHSIGKKIYINLRDAMGNTPLVIAALKKDNLEVVRCLVEAGADVNGRNTLGATPLNYAATEARDLDMVEYLIAKGADINCQDKEGRTILHTEMGRSRNVDMVKYFIAKGADINCQDKEGRTILHAPMDMAKYLIKKGADINCQDKEGRTILHAAAGGWGNLDVVKYLIAEGADINCQDKEGRTILHAAAGGWGNLDVVKYLIAEGADINCQDKEGRTILHVAAGRSRNLDMVEYLFAEAFDIIRQHKGGRIILHAPMDMAKYLIKKGADINCQDKEGRTILHAAMDGSGDSDTVKYLIKKGADINCQDKEGRTILHAAMDGSGDSDTVKYLIKKGADINCQDKKGRTILHVAAGRSGNLDMVKYLFAEGADINCQDKEGRTILHAAAGRSGNLDIVKYLIAEGADINCQDKEGRTILHAAAGGWGNLDVVKYLIAEGADINCQDKEGRTILHAAAGGLENLDVVKYLIAEGADINCQDKEGRTVLHAAASSSCNLDVVKYLIAVGADINCQDKEGRTILHAPMDMAKYLIKKGADINCQDKEGRTILHAAACGWGNLDVVKYLIAEGADINCQDKEGRTILHVAAGRSRNLDTVRYLIAAGADINCQDKEGRTILHAAAGEVGDLNRVEYLIAKDADVNTQTLLGYTPWNRAVIIANNLAVVKYLIEKGANINVRDENGRTPLQYARDEASNSDNIVKYLEEKEGDDIIAD